MGQPAGNFMVPQRQQVRHQMMKRLSMPDKRSGQREMIEEKGIFEGIIEMEGVLPKK